MRSKLLYVVKGEAACLKDGFTYAKELSKVVKGGLYILFHYDRKMLRTFEDEMTAVAFAEAGESETAQEILREREHVLKAEAEKRIQIWKKECENPDLITKFDVVTGDLLSAIRQILQNHAGIEIVILSPSLMERNKPFSIRRLRKYIHRPVVTMSRQIQVEGSTR